MSTISWKKVIQIALDEAREYYIRHGLPLKLRGLFYILVSKGVIPNTSSMYQRLSRRLANARYVGIFPWEYIQDTIRPIYWGDIGYSIPDAEKILEEVTSLTPEQKEEILKEYLKNRYSVTIRQWENQPYRVIIVVEKDAVFSTLQSMIRYQLGWDVTMTFSRGFESASQAKKIADYIISLRKNSLIPVILLIYDFDPSGEYASIRDFIFRVLLLAVNKNVPRLLKIWKKAKDEEKVEILNALTTITGVKWEKVMLTWEQIIEYNIPPKPEFLEVIEKLKRDPRKRWFIEKYGDLYQAEIDAMIALRPEETKKIIDKAIKKYFDVEIYNEVKRKSEELERKLTELLK